SAVKTQLPDSRRDGICDLVWRNRKFSGNALRVARSHTLYHGTVLYGYDVELIEHCLAFAPRQPTYRQGRSHDAFVTNAPIDPVQLSLDLTIGFSAVSTVSNEMIRSQVRPIADRLVDERYGRNEWRFKR
ncbi:MAG: lipoate--protein ligase family protein, partial [Planctomycetota bacterium]